MQLIKIYMEALQLGSEVVMVVVQGKMLVLVSLQASGHVSSSLACKPVPLQYCKQQAYLHLKPHLLLPVQLHLQQDWSIGVITLNTISKHHLQLLRCNCHMPGGEMTGTKPQEGRRRGWGAAPVVTSWGACLWWASWYWDSQCCLGQPVLRHIVCRFQLVSPFPPMMFMSCTGFSAGFGLVLPQFLVVAECAASFRADSD